MIHELFTMAEEMIARNCSLHKLTHSFDLFEELIDRAGLKRDTHHISTSREDLTWIVAVLQDRYILFRITEMFLFGLVNLWYLSTQQKYIHTNEQRFYAIDIGMCIFEFSYLPAKMTIPDSNT
jgi:hypothetical protein